MEQQNNSKWKKPVLCITIEEIETQTYLSDWLFGW